MCFYHCFPLLYEHTVNRFVTEDKRLYTYGSTPLTLSYLFLQAKTSIEEVTAHMRPHNCNVMFLSRNFDKPSDSPLAKDMKEEFWYKTKYTSKGKSWFVE